MHLAVGTSLAVIVPTSLRSFAGHRARGAVDMALLKSMALPVIAGVVLGALLARYADEAVLQASGSQRRAHGGQADLRARELAARRRGPGAAVPGALRRLRRPGVDPDEHRRRRLHHRPDDLLRPADPARGRTSSGFGPIIAVPAPSASSGRAGTPPACRRARSATSACSARSDRPDQRLAAPLGVRIAHGISRRTLELAFATFLPLVGGRFLISLLA